MACPQLHLSMLALAPSTRMGFLWSPLQSIEWRTKKTGEFADRKPSLSLTYSQFPHNVTPELNAPSLCSIPIKLFSPSFNALCSCPSSALVSGLPVPSAILSVHPLFYIVNALTIENSLHTGSLGCAPTPSQYFVRNVSSCSSLYRFCFFAAGLVVLGDGASADGLTIGSSSAEARGIRGKGSYVPRTSMGLESRAVLVNVSWGF
jgi:hypothetical protein